MKRLVLSSLVLSLLLVGCTGNNLENEPVGNVNESVVIEDEVVQTEFGDEIINMIEAEVSQFDDTSLNHYDIDVTLDTEVDTLTARQVVTYHHNDTDLDKLYFHLYPNAFSKDGHPSLFDTHVDEIDQQFGHVEIVNLTINGQAVEYGLAPITTVLEIDYELVEGETYTIEMDYVVSISTTSERFGTIDDVYNLGNWYPVLAVYDEEGYHLDPYYSVGDPFYSEMSNYDVVVHVPADYEVAASGTLTDFIDDQVWTYVYQVNGMRDFAMVIAKDFNLMTAEVDDTLVTLYYRDDLKDHKWLDDALKYGATSIGFYSDIIGDYPYPQYNVVLTMFPSGMEYPGMVMISDEYVKSYGLNNVREVIVHETAHQWFYAMIGNDEIADGWIDEGLTSFFTSYYDLHNGYSREYKNTMSWYADRVENYGFDNVDVRKSAADIDDWGEYGLTAYTKPALMYNELLNEYGEEKIEAFAQYLFQNFKGGILKEDDLRAALEHIYGSDVVPFVDEWLK